MDEKTCSACGGSGWVADGNEAKLCDCYQNRVYAVNVVSSRVPGRYFGSRLQDFELDTIKSKKALIEARRFLSEGITNGTGLLLQGPAGVGKTFLAAAILLEALNRPGVSGFFLDTRDFLAGIREKLQGGDGGKKEIKFACNADVVVIDDLGNCRETEWADDVISLIISRRYNEKRSTIFTTNYFDDGTENDLSKKIGYRLRSRLYTMAYPVIIDGTDRRRMK